VTAKVVDASAVVALMFSEPTRDNIVERVRDADLCAPELVHYEVASACLKKIRARPMERDALLARLASVGELGIELVSVDIEQTTALAASTNLSLYDASYLWLARHLGIELVTLDQRLQKASAKI
jgi:predicted nucleic acid-binding protein